MDSIAYDPILKRPGCVLLQAAFGCDPRVAHEFDTRHWLLAPTPDLQVFPCTPELLVKIVQITEKANPA